MVAHPAIFLPSVLFLYSSFFTLFFYFSQSVFSFVLFSFFPFFSLHYRLFFILYAAVSLLLLFSISFLLFSISFLYCSIYCFSFYFFFCFTYLKILSARPPGCSLGQSSLDVTTNWGQDTSSNTWHNSLAHYLVPVVQKICFFPSIADIVSNDYIDIFFLFANERSPGINDFFSDVSY